MRVFVLTTGRSGSTTFAVACGHIANFTSAHESRAAALLDRCAYPDRHIEVDNRLSWFLGTLDRLYGAEPLYVYLMRDPERVAQSYARRHHIPVGLVRAFGQGLILRREPLGPDTDWLAIARLCVATIDDNIELFLKDKPNVLRVSLDHIEEGFGEMWRRIGAEGSFEQAISELRQRHNSSEEVEMLRRRRVGLRARSSRILHRVASRP